jgi:hypothetical protein
MKLHEVATPEYVLYVDLDGVLADLTTYVEDLLGITIKTQSDGNWHNDDEIWDEIRKRDGEPNFQNLQPLSDAMELWNFLKPYKPHILTATGHPEEANAKKKREWVKRHLSGYGEVHTVPKSKLKAQFAAPNHILIDDRTKSTRPWKQAGGIAILHKSAAKTIAKLKELGF